VSTNVKNHYKTANLEKALAQLQAFCATPHPTQIEIAGIIQAFEFTFEQFWKAIKHFAENQGYLSNSPRSALKQGLKLEYFSDEKTWLKMLEDRNETSHVYHEQLAHEIYERIVTRYLPEFLKAAEKLRQSATVP